VQIALISEAHMLLVKHFTWKHKLVELSAFKFVCNKNIYVEWYEMVLQTKKKLHGLSPRANYTDRATAACLRS
jgi:hypothetical protein